MYLYTPAALTLLGGISPGQMFSIIYAGVVATNDAFENSLIPLTFNLAYVGLVSLRLGHIAGRDGETNKFEVAIFRVLDLYGLVSVVVPWRVD